jgi:hypothetical protein
MTIQISYCDTMRKTRGEKPKQMCEVAGCNAESERSMSRKNVKEAMEWDLKGGDRNVGLCREHYREFKKATKDGRKLEMLRR